MKISFCNHLISGKVRSMKNGKPTSIRRGVGSRSSGGLTGTSDGGVVLSGNFNTSWLLGQADEDDDFAALLPEGEDVKSFDSFLAHMTRTETSIGHRHRGWPGMILHSDFPVISMEVSCCSETAIIMQTLDPILRK